MLAVASPLPVREADPPTRSSPPSPLPRPSPPAVVGFGVGPLFFAPLSEQFGRTPIIIISVFCYWIFIFPSAFAHNAASTVAGRMFSGLGASAPMCLVGGSLADLWEDRERGIPLAIFSQTLFLGYVEVPADFARLLRGP